MKNLRRKSAQMIQYTPVIQQEKSNGEIVVVPCGRPITASNQKELEKKMKNRMSALEARNRAKQKESELENQLHYLMHENLQAREINERLKHLINEYTRLIDEQECQVIEQTPQKEHHMDYVIEQHESPLNHHHHIHSHPASMDDHQFTAPYPVSPISSDSGHSDTSSVMEIEEIQDLNLLSCSNEQFDATLDHLFNL